MGIGFKDIVALATAGYKPSDIKELIELSKVTNNPEEASEETETHEELTNSVQNATEEDQEIVTDDSLDYKKKLEEATSKLQEMEERIQKLQKANTKEKIADSDNEISDSQVFADAMKNFM